MTGKFRSSPLAMPLAMPVFALALVLVGCAGGRVPSLTGTPGGTAMAPLPPPSISPDDIVGKWGLGAYHRPEDRARTEAAARSQCRQPYVINRSATGVSMLGYDNPQVQDMTIKAGYDGKTYIGPGPTPGSAGDRQVVSFDGRVLVLTWVSPEVASRYGTMVLVRCGKSKKSRSAAQ